MPLPTTLRKRDGRLEDFELDKLSRSLFAATEAIGAPNAFLARELADSVLHFLANEDGTITTTDQLSDLTAKVVRELGHPALAKVYRDDTRQPRQMPKAILGADQSPAPVTRNDLQVLCEKAAAAELSRFSLQSVYPRDLASAHREGLLELLDLQTPFELTGILLPGHCPVDPGSMFETLRVLRTLAGSFVAIDSRENLLGGGANGQTETRTAEFVDAFEKITRTLGLRGILNLNVAELPSGENGYEAGPLFADVAEERELQQLDRVAVLILRASKDTSVIWHLAERDFRDDAADRLQAVVEIALTRDNVDFAFDRARRAIVMGPGISRCRPAALGAVGMNLERFVQHLGGGRMDREVFLGKLRSLARFAKTAGHARLNFLRKHGDPRLREGFLLESAVETVVPRGLIEAARIVVGAAGAEVEVLELACESLAAIHSAIENDSARTIATAVDFPLDAGSSFAATTSDVASNKQLRQVKLQGEAAGGGLGRILMKRNRLAIVKDIPELLRTAWRSELARLRFAWVD